MALQNLIRKLLIKPLSDYQKITKLDEEEVVIREESLERRCFKKLKILVYTDSRGSDIVNGSSYEFYTQKLKNKYDTELVIKTRKWTTVFDFIEYYDKSNKNYDIVIAHVGISDWSPRPISQVKKIYSMKRASILKLIPRDIYKKHMQNDMGVMYEGEPTNNLYSLEMARKYIIPHMRGIPNLIFISSNAHILENKGNYFKDRPTNINLAEKYSDLFCKNLPNVINLSKWTCEEVSVNTYDGMHLNKKGSDYLIREVERAIASYVNSTNDILVRSLIGKKISDFQGRNFEIPRENYKDKPLFILGSGPSLGMINVTKLKNCYTMSFNRSYIAFKDWGFEPTYFVGLDFVVNNDNKEKYKKLIQNSSIKRYFFSRHELYKNYLKNPKVSFIDIIGDPMHPNLDFKNKLRVGNSGLFGLQIAIGLLGFQEIFLIGCDANYKEIVPGVKTVDGKYVSTSDNDINHFRKDYYGKGTTYNKPGNLKYHYPAWKAFYEKFVKTKLLGIKIYNCSPISKLNFFEYKDFKKVLKNISDLELPHGKRSQN